MEIKKAIELIKKSDLSDKEKNSLIKLIEKQGLTKEIRDRILKAFDQHVKSLEQDVVSKQQKQEQLRKEAKRDQAMLDLIYWKVVKRIRDAYLNYDKEMGKLDVKMDSAFKEAVKIVEAKKKSEIMDMIK